MIELRDVLVGALAAAGAFAAVRIEIRHLWRTLGEYDKRLERLEDRIFREEH